MEAVLQFKDKSKKEYAKLEMFVFDRKLVILLNHIKAHFFSTMSRKSY